MKLGQASTEAERSAEAAIARITDWQRRPLSYHRISSGITNLNWKVHLEDEGRTYFMKVHGAGTPLFIDRESALEAATRAAEAGAAPRVLYYIEDAGIEVHEFLEGYRSSNAGDLMDHDIRCNIALTLKSLHAAPVLTRTFTGFEQLERLLALAREHKARLPRDLDAMLWQFGRAKRAIEAAGVTLAPCYNDGYVSNYMVDAQSNVKLVDWEYAANNDPYWDLTLIANDAFVHPQAVREMIEAHDGRYTDEAEARIRLYWPLCAFSWSMWASLQDGMSTVPFDFAKYAELLQLRARHALADPRWESALTRL